MKVTFKNVKKILSKQSVLSKKYIVEIKQFKLLFKIGSINLWKKLFDNKYKLFLFELHNRILK